MTAYDYPMAKLLDDVGLDFILVGDSLGMVVLGYPDTTGVRMEDMLHHTRAVARGASKTWIVADLPAGSYPSPEAAVENSARLIEAGADAVKIEGGRECLVSAVVLELVHPPVAEKISRSVKIPTIGIGSGPSCDGQILVLHDVIGLFPWFRPKFAKARADLAAEVTRAAAEFVAEARSGAEG